MSLPSSMQDSNRSRTSTAAIRERSPSLFLVIVLFSIYIFSWQVSVPMSTEFEELKKLRENPADEANNMVEFSDEEGYGKFLDLHEVYTMFINLKGVERMDYISYITSFDQLYDVPRDRKGGEYRKYLAALLDYLWSFMTRTRPLLDLEVEMAEVLKDFDSKFERGELPGWAREQVGYQVLRWLP